MIMDGNLILLEVIIKIFQEDKKGGCYYSENRGHVYML
jgi:hypothetical protein